MLTKAGVPVKVVSERLGHGNPAFTIDTYQHVLPGMQAEAARTFEVASGRSRLFLILLWYGCGMENEPRHIFGEFERGLERPSMWTRDPCVVLGFGPDLGGL